MAERSALTASSFGVDHLTLPIPWSSPPFPPRPSPGQLFENVARDARYELLFRGMTQTGAKILALGHHADDQVETALMRLGRGTTELGAAGMRRCRRWGMGQGSGEQDVGWAGFLGMERWIVRPLLEFGKDRLLATCEENGLEYVVDQTNFQPEVTLRNAIRHMLSHPEEQDLMSTNLPLDIAQKISRIREASESFTTVDLDLTGSKEQLQSAIQKLGSRVEDIDIQVDSNLSRRTVPSPPGTFLLSTHSLHRIHSPAVRTALILRIMRYVSSHPWGSLRSDGQRRQTSLQQVVDKIWNRDPLGNGIGAFVAGAGVLWSPMSIGPRGEMKALSAVGKGKGGKIGWLASRQPPLRAESIAQSGKRDPLNIDVTSSLVCEMESEGRTLDVLYDNRFLVRFNVEKMPEEVRESLGKPGSAVVRIEPQTRWYWPKVSWKKGDEWVDLASGVPAVENAAVMVDEKYLKKLRNAKNAGWIDIRWIRVLSAL